MNKMIGGMVGGALVVLVLGGCEVRRANREASVASPKVSVFSFAIDDVAKERGVSFKEAARLLKEAGVSGFDCSYDDRRLDEYLATGLLPSNLYGQMKFFDDDGGVARAQAFVDTAVRVGCPRIMLLADDFTDGEPNEAEFAKIVKGVRMLVDKGRAKGVTVMVETYGNRKNCCSYAKDVIRLLDEVPGLCFAADTGNLHYAGRGDDIVAVAKHAGKRIAHVHFKDFVSNCSSEDVRRLRPFCSIGLGAVPNEKIARYVKSIGYDGWYTLEHLVRGDTLGDVRRQISSIRRWLSTEPEAGPRALWTRTIAREPGRYIGWPTVATLRDGTLIAVFSGDRDWHADPYGKIQFVKSTDDGETWSAPVTIADTIIDDRDCGIVELPDGELLVTWFTSVAWRKSGAYRMALNGPKPNESAESRMERTMAERWVAFDRTVDTNAEKRVGGYCAVRSRDRGKTWSPVERIGFTCSAPHGPIVLRDGSLLLVGRRGVKIAEGSNLTPIRAERSTDGGRTWQVLCSQLTTTKADVGDANLLFEPHVAELPSGRLVTLVRYEGKDDLDCLREATSEDGGRTWSPLAKTGIHGYPAHLKTLRDGRLLAAYSRRDVWREGVKRGIFAVLSADGGRTWDIANEIALGAEVPKAVHNGHFGYPSTTETADGAFLTTYYETLTNDVKPALVATKWLLGGAAKQDLK